MPAGAPIARPSSHPFLKATHPADGAAAAPARAAAATDVVHHRRAHRQTRRAAASRAAAPASSQPFLENTNARVGARLAPPRATGRRNPGPPSRAARRKPPKAPNEHCEPPITPDGRRCAASRAPRRPVGAPKKWSDRHTDGRTLNPGFRHPVTIPKKSNKSAYAKTRCEINMQTTSI